MKVLWCILCLMLIVSLNALDVVINEVLYDPDGADTGYEWIELYNSSDLTINLQGWTIEKAGVLFELVFTFPNINIEPSGFLLVGEEFVPNTDLIASLAFQNGGSETDGIRLISTDGMYTDTILYDSPNTNELPDDISNPGEYFAPDVDSGNTLARKHDGEDSNNCEIDFFECIDPTPGEANFYPIDLALNYLVIYENNGEYWLQTEVENLSTENVDNLTASINISVNDTLNGTYELPAIPAESTILFSCQILELIIGYHQISAELIYLYDNELWNNYAESSLLNGASPFVLNEIMFKPLSTNQEWIEIFNRTNCVYSVDNLKIMDASGSIISFNGNIPPLDFIVVCHDTILFLQIYPDIDPEKVIFAPQWTSLNNTDETLLFTDEFETKFDSTSYNGTNCPVDFSIERVNPFDDENIQWSICTDSLGTPTFPNSVFPMQYDLSLEFNNMQINENSIAHTVIIRNIGLENIFDAIISCELIMNGEYPSENIFVDEISLEDSTTYEFTTDIVQNGYFSFLYEVISEDDMNPANNINFSFYNNGFLPFVINEIMYDPDGDEPEWIEIINNFQISDLTEIVLVVDEDTLEIPYYTENYYLITNSENDVDYLKAKYDIDDITILTGLSSLSNDGEQMCLMDECGNLIEEFFYQPEWNDELDGVSIERVNPEIISTEQNWGPSTNQCTPGRANSIFVQMLPNNMKLNVEPNPFSPYRDERTIFSYVLPEVLSTVTLRIFDLKGRMIRRLVDQVLQSSTGNIIWDGRNDNGKKLPVGVYIVLMQATARESEKVYSKKITVVIGK
ncbi:MAG: lamin tail domain-containing protein [Candidatus Cloacimonadota bacterium]|nr:lamin tail domain-containing protein [Candidatus Cloacimonadota bacterium]